VEEVVHFYRRVLPPLGWKLVGEEAAASEKRLRFLQDGAVLAVWVEPKGELTQLRLRMERQKRTVQPKEEPRS